MLVLNAIESAVSRSLARGRAAEEHAAGAVAEDPVEEGEPEHPLGARRADALMRIRERWLHETSRQPLLQLRGRRRRSRFTSTSGA